METSFVIKSIAYLIGLYQRIQHPQHLQPWECTILMAFIEECSEVWAYDIVKYYRAGTREE